MAALVLAAKSDATALSQLPPAAFAELAAVTGKIEQSLARFRPFDKINYLALMMVDPHVHFHVLPRYATAQDFAGMKFPDHGWPGVPDLKQAPQLDDPQRSALHAALLDAFGGIRLNPVAGSTVLHNH